MGVWDLFEAAREQTVQRKTGDEMGVSSGQLMQRHPVHAVL